MMSDNQKNQAIRTWKTVRDALNGMQWVFDTDDDKYTAYCCVAGKNFPMTICIVLELKQMIVSVYSYLPFDVPKEKLPDTCIATCAINKFLIYGNFELNMLRKKMLYRATTSYRESVLSESAIKYLIFLSCSVVDKYGGKLSSIAEGKTSLEELMNWINNPEERDD